MADNKIFLFIEGDSSLRQGFSALFDTNKVKISMCEAQSETIKKFKSEITNNFLNCKDCFLLIDLDKPDEQREEALSNCGLLKEEYKSRTFFMVQEMEAWFIAQKKVLDDYYQKDSNGKLVSTNLPNTPPAQIGEPVQLLKKATKNTKKKEYHKTKHAPDLLKKLDINELRKTFADFNSLETAIADSDL